MVEIDANGMTIYSVEKIRLKKEDILMFVFPGRLHPEQLKNFTNSLPNELQIGLNCLLFTYDEIVKILSSQYNPLKDYLERWFGDYEFIKENDECLYFSEDGIEVEKDDYWLVNIKTDYACSFKDIDRLNRKVYELEKVDDNDK